MKRTMRPPGAASETPPSAEAVRRIRRAILAWYDANRRDLPWRRRQKDPYAQWVAEIMLQQTRVDTVRDYYERFMRRFPDVRALARARRETVLKHWEGLGYYRRALHLHEAARTMHRDGGNMPRTAAALERLPGIGRYTAAAVASIAYGEPVAAVDGNVARVLARLFAIREDILTPGGRARVQQAADALLAPRRPGDFNQAWMDLGSEVCTPRNPNCVACPLRNCCRAAQHGLVDELPLREGGRPDSKPQQTMLTVLFVHRGRVLVTRRPRGGLWSELWEFPGVDSTGERSTARAVARLAIDAHVRPNGRPRHVGVVRHELTHRSLTFRVVVTKAEPAHGESGVNRSRRWVDAYGLARLSVSTAHRRVFDAAGSALGRLGFSVTTPVKPAS